MTNQTIILLIKTKVKAITSLDQFFGCYKGKKNREKRVTDVQK
ncbi:hypothetical protein BATR1942_06885 [Bacillus atrophaeus 1942]|uniref:Uncharacterized protein n=1 Tax=Bacillus atrophaeus (strain 1942) TaxID=720555 RepID=A0ABN3Z8V9_BACA1|nr:hypothetical protein BATR1942_06885 [Bacillus atrophaeus 1942]